MYRVIKSYLFFFAIFVFAIQNVGAVSFKTNYKIVINNQQIGTLRRTVNREGNVSINLNLMHLSEAETSHNGVELMEMIMSGKILSLIDIFHHMQSLLSGSSSASASSTLGNEISMALIEATGQSSSITYSFLGHMCHYSESSESDGIAIFIGGQREMYSSSPQYGFHVQALAQTTLCSEVDEGIEQTTTIQASHIGDIGSLAVASLSDAHGVEVMGQYFLFGKKFEQLLTILVEGQNNNSGLLYLRSIFPIFVMPPGQDTYQISHTGYGQGLTYDSASNMITQQDLPSNPSPFGTITTYQLDSDGFITSIVISEVGDAVVMFSSEEITQSSEETGTPGSSDTSASDFEPAAYNLPFSSQLMPAFILVLSYCQIDDQKTR